VRGTYCIESPVSQRLREIPRGNGEWPGYSHVYANLARGCEAMGRNVYVRLSEEHINAMAVLGSGDENGMKYEQARMRRRGFIE